MILSDMPREPITVTLPDGSTKEGTSWESSPMSIALGISKSLAEKTVIAKVQSRVTITAVTVSELTRTLRIRSMESFGISSDLSRNLLPSNSSTLNTLKASIPLSIFSKSVANGCTVRVIR
jgi:hypothetical protein